jgi:hypothetical protein
VTGHKRSSITLLDKDWVDRSRLGEGSMRLRPPLLSRRIGLCCILVALSMITRRPATVETVPTLLQTLSMMFLMFIVGVITPAGGSAGSRAQYLVVRHARGCGHSRRLGNADQEPVRSLCLWRRKRSSSVRQLHDQKFL